MGAVFPNRLTAEAAIAELRAHALADEQLGIAIREPDNHVFEERTEAVVAHGVERGIAVGAPLGAIAGMSVLALIVPGLGTLGVAGVLAAGGISGAVAGSYLGALFGLAAEDHVLTEEWDWERLPLQPGQILVVPSDHDEPQAVTRILERHEGAVIPKPRHVA